MVRTSTKSAAMKVIRSLRDAGHEALFAGGCVRDMLLGEGSTDYDVATSATPGQVKRLFRRCLMVGAKFGVAVVLVHDAQIEVATFRSDVSYSDGRRPDAVHFSSAREDALRRDFTINGMFYDPLDERLIDYVGGQSDLEAGVIRTIGDPDQRFDEDYLRMLRAVRFAVRFDFHLEPATREAVRRHAPRITRISGERIYDELSKMLARPSAPRAMEMLAEVSLAPHVFAPLFEAPARWESGLERVRLLSDRPDAVLNLSALLADLPTGRARRLTRDWGTSNTVRDTALWLARHLSDWQTADRMPLADLKRLLADPRFDRLRRLWRAEEKRRTGRRRQSRRIKDRIAEIPPEKVDPPPWITGEDLMEMGLEEGPALGSILHQVREAQLAEEIDSRAEALKMARQLVDKQGEIHQ